MLATMKKELTAREMQSRGGKARARNLSPEERSRIASLAAKARWSKQDGANQHTRINGKEVLGKSK